MRPSELALKGAERAIVDALEDVKEDGLLQAQLIKLTGYSKSTISEALARLEERGLIVRERKGREALIWLSKHRPAEEVRILRLGFVRALEYAYTPLFEKALRSRGFLLKPKPYDNGLLVLRDLATGRLELAMAPLVAQLAYYVATRGAIKILGACGRGGSSLVASPRIAEVRDLEGEGVGSTAFSTMEAALLKAVQEEGVDVASLRVKHYSSPEELMRGVGAREVEAVSIWEPYATILTRSGFKRMARYRELIGDFVCCVLSCRSGLQGVDIVADCYNRSLQGFLERAEESVEAYARATGLPCVKEALGDLAFIPSLEVADVTRTLARMGLAVFIPIAREALLDSAAREA